MKVTEEQLEKLLSECTHLLMNGELVYDIEKKSLPTKAISFKTSPNGVYFNYSKAYLKLGTFKENTLTLPSGIELQFLKLCTY